jgi:L-ascorbate metabolism protein UlaG (beta-lactamase superfamily)
MSVRLLRHATVWIDIGGHRLLVDPMLDAPGARAPVRGTPAERPNPLVPLPVSPDEALEGVEAVLLTHTHVDHIDAAGVTALIQALGPVSGFAVAAEGEPTVYVAGDTVWCPEVAAAIEAHDPGWIVVNAGGARFLQGGTITMEAGDVIAVAEAAPGARVVAVHLEAINHCLETREELRGGLDAAGLADRVAVPADGETVSA